MTVVAFASLAHLMITLLFSSSVQMAHNGGTTKHPTMLGSEIQSSVQPPLDVTESSRVPKTAWVSRLEMTFLVDVTCASRLAAF